MPDKVVKGIYHHFKGGLYETIGVATHSETGENLVVYRPLYGSYELTVRPLAMFLEEVNVPGRGYKEPRFLLVHEISDFLE